MRSYIFTEREREIIRKFLKGEIPRNDPAVEQLRSRLKGFSELAADVDLYVKMKEETSR
jgi:hypothetical protein